jgi:diaminopimelate epimerase
MIIPFTKIHGSGNDFILIDNRELNIQLTREHVIHLCDRHRGIGADGILLWVPSRSGKADWAWHFFQQDGETADMCGNGSRCFGRFIHHTLQNEMNFTFETGAGIVSVKAAHENARMITVTLTDPKDICVNALMIDIPESSPLRQRSIHSVHMGVPHAVEFVPNVQDVNVLAVGRALRIHAHFPSGTNVNFAQIIGPNHLRVRSYERGVEGETLACGTGVTAAALVAARVHAFTSPVQVDVASGDCLLVSFQTEHDSREFRQVQLTGPTEIVFVGSLEWNV